MKANITKILAGAVFAMGIIHNVATFTPLIQNGLDVLPEGKQKALLYMSLMCGTLLMTCGAVAYNLADKVKEHEFLKTPYNIIVFVTTLSGCLAAYSMPHNPFAWVLFAITTAFAANHIIILKEHKK